jgi:HK97 family phage major capsid protein
MNTHQLIQKHGVQDVFLSRQKGYFKPEEMPMWALPLLLLFVGVLLTMIYGDITGGHNNGLATASMAAFGLFTPLGVLRDKDAPDPKGSGGGEDFEETVLNGIKALKTKQDEVTAKIDNATKETKDCFKELSQLQKKNGDLETKLISIEKAQIAVRREVQLNWGNPIDRINANEEMRTLFSAMVRHACLGKAGVTELSEVHQKALDTINSPGSLNLVSALMKEVYDTMASYGAFTSFDVKTLTAKSTSMRVRTARLKMKVKDEAATGADDTNKAGTSVVIAVKTIFGIVYVSEELLQDSDSDIVSEVLPEFGEAAAERLDHFAIAANGVANDTDGGFTGIFNGGVAAVAAAGHLTVEQLSYEDFIKCLTSVDAGILRRVCKWWSHPQILARALSVKDGNNRPIFLNAIDAPTYGGLGSILGYGVVPAHVAPSTNAASSKVMAFGDPKGNVVGIRRAFEFAASSEAAFADFEVAMRAVMRAASKIRRQQAFAVLTTAAAE